MVGFHCSTKCQGFPERLTDCRQDRKGKEKVKRVEHLSHLHNQGLCFICFIQWGYSFPREKGSASLKSVETAVLGNAQIIRKNQYLVCPIKEKQLWRFHVCTCLPGSKVHVVTVFPPCPSLPLLLNTWLHAPSPTLAQSEGKPSRSPARTDRTGPINSFATIIQISKEEVRPFTGQR